MPGVTFHGDGWGNNLNSSKTTTKISIDSEAISLVKGDLNAGFWVADEYGPGLFKFSGSSGSLSDYIKVPDAFLPFVNGTLNYSSDNPPSWDPYSVPDQDSGRDRNKGFEGMDISPDGKTLVALLQSAADQEGGTKKKYAFNARLIMYDLTQSPPKAIGEYVIQLPTTSDGKTCAQSELRWISDNLVLVLPRDSGNGKGQDDTVSEFRHIDIYDLSCATNILGMFDGEGDAIASKKGVLNENITPAEYHSFIDMNDANELSKFGLSNGGNGYLSLNEKWEENF
ncbi:unnamed protein product [Ambrosiozyma monospora]|uniref:Unnamed protein product n=1 Tax=Ambrosiozyma monospora TaxID=43982 RepID=A0ACB5U6S6_AMBMO|nr:unnamed protein product [Ambrosiozyma monospora]